jgi:hypothetical protein
MAVRPIPRREDFEPVDETEIASQRPIGVSSGIQGLPGTTNVDPVFLGYAGTTAPYGSPRPVYSNVYEQRQQLSRLRAEARKSPDARAQYNGIVSLLQARGYLGPRTKPTGENVDQAWMDLLKENAAAADSVFAATPSDLLLGGSPSDMPAAAGSGGRGGAYTGPVRSVTVQAETDIVASARAAAEELLGRMPTQQELDRILKRTRSAEQAQPTVQTRQGPGRGTTAEGLTKEGRDNILRQVLMQSPDYQDYQIDSTVMDMMLTNLRRGQEVARG